MKKLLRSFLINLVSLTVAVRLLPAFNSEGGAKTLVLGALVFMFINILFIALIRILFLPLNLLTLGIFAWVVNVVGLYILTLAVPQFRLLPYSFPGVNFNGLVIPHLDLNILEVAIIVSFLIGLITNFLKWLTSN